MAFKREIQGVIVKQSGDKTISVLVERKVVHPKYHKIVKFLKHYCYTCIYYNYVILSITRRQRSDYASTTKTSTKSIRFEPVRIC